MNPKPERGKSNSYSVTPTIFTYKKDRKNLQQKSWTMAIELDAST